MTTPAPEQPGGDPWLSARLAALTALIKGERNLFRLASDMFSKWLGKIRGRVLPDPKTIDPAGVFSEGPLWRELTADFVAKGVAPILEFSYNQARHTIGLPDIDSDHFDTMAYVVDYLAEVENKLVNVPDELFDDIRRVLAAGVGEGRPIPDIASEIEKELLDGNAAVWTNRAVVVARTEVIGANNGGQYRAFQDIERAEGTRFVKRWLATHDHRTRPTHREADGQTVPLTTPFTVGGFQGQFPGAKTLPPQEAIQCRCTALFFPEGDEPA